MEREWLQNIGFQFLGGTVPEFRFPAFETLAQTRVKKLICLNTAMIPYF
jgi:hypothetical protein